MGWCFIASMRKGDLWTGALASVTLFVILFRSISSGCSNIVIVMEEYIETVRENPEGISLRLFCAIDQQNALYLSLHEFPEQRKTFAPL